MHGKLLQKYSHAAEHPGVKTEKKKKDDLTTYSTFIVYTTCTSSDGLLPYAEVVYGGARAALIIL